MKFTKCPSCDRVAIATVAQLFENTNLECTNCGVLLRHSTPIMVSILTANLIAYLLVVRVIINEGLPLVVAVTFAFTLSLFMMFIIFLPLVVVEAEVEKVNKHTISKWYLSPVPYFCFITVGILLWNVM